MYRPQTWILVVVVCLSLTSYSQQQTHKQGTTCEAPTVEAGSRGHVKCHVPPHIVQSTPVSLSLDRYTLNMSTSVNVMECYWTTPSYPGQCHLKPGYMFNKELSADFTVHINSSAGQHQGKYVCQAMAMSTSESEGDLSGNLPCTFIVNGTTTPPPELPTSQVDQTSTPTPAEITKEEEGGGAHLALVVGLPVAGGVIIIIIVAVVIVVYLRRKQSLPTDTTLQRGFDEHGHGVNVASLSARPVFSPQTRPTLGGEAGGGKDCAFNEVGYTDKTVPGPCKEDEEDVFMASGCGDQKSQHNQTPLRHGVKEIAQRFSPGSVSQSDQHAPKHSGLVSPAPAALVSPARGGARAPLIDKRVRRFESSSQVGSDPQSSDDDQGDSGPTEPQYADTTSPKTPVPPVLARLYLDNNRHHDPRRGAGELGTSLILDSTADDSSTPLLDKIQSTSNEHKGQSTSDEHRGQSTSDEDGSTPLLDKIQPTSDEDGSTPLLDKIQSTSDEDGSTPLLDKIQPTSDEDGSTPLLDKIQSTSDEDGSTPLLNKLQSTSNEHKGQSTSDEHGEADEDCSTPLLDKTRATPGVQCRTADNDCH